MAHEVCRRVLSGRLGDRTPRTAHAGLLLRRGMTHFENGGNGGDPGKGGTAKRKLIERVARLDAPDLYRCAYARWQAATADTARFTRFEAALAGRLYIGVTRESALETGMTVHHAYGMPLIPGSAVKGLARSCARARLPSEHPDAVEWLFGPDSENGTEAASGGIVFHDAWWVPDGKPFAAEVVTPHHRGYYNLGKAPATDFDSPVPAPQLAAQGSFLFVLEGDPGWCAVASKLLESGLEELGIGGKRSSGYGSFTHFTDVSR